MNNLIDAELSRCLSIGYREGDPADSYVYSLAYPDEVVFYIGKIEGF